MKKLVIGLLAIATMIALISCGGGGTSVQLSPTAQKVQSLQRLSFLSMGNSGLYFFGFGFGGGGGTTGSGTSGGGGGGGVSSIGGFIRNFGGPGGLRALRHLQPLGVGTSGSTSAGSTTTTSAGGTTDAGTDGGGGGTGGDYFYYDEWMQLWVATTWTETEFTSLFYLDQGKTQPAGHVTSTFVSDWTVYPQVYTSEYEFTGGTLAGSNGTYNCTQTSESAGGMTYHNTYSDGSHDQGTSNWDETGYHWTSRWENQSGSVWYQDGGDWASDFSGTYTCSNSDGWSSTWNYNADWSGSAHFEGPNPLLPADLVWTATGHFTITYADGKTEEWDWEDLWGGEGQEGTSGTTGSGGFRPVG